MKSAMNRSVNPSMKSFYLIAAIVGAVIPLALFAEHFAAAGFDPAPSSARCSPIRLPRDLRPMC